MCMLNGSNVGISIPADGRLQAQNRGHYLHAPFHGQFTRLGDWLAVHEDAMFDALGEHLVAFGEWCAARHSLDYASLPDWWMLFDIYDRREGRSWSTRRRDTCRTSVAVAYSSHRAARARGCCCIEATSGVAAQLLPQRSNGRGGCAGGSCRVVDLSRQAGAGRLHATDPRPLAKPAIGVEPTRSGRVTYFAWSVTYACRTSSRSCRATLNFLATSSSSSMAVIRMARLPRMALKHGEMHATRPMHGAQCNSLVKRGETSAMFDGECEQIGVC